MFSLRISGPTAGDCTAPYSVQLDKEYTVEELVNAIITNRSDEWGSIKLGSIIGPHICSYRHGVITSPIPDEYKGAMIANISAHGGWSNMDYAITVAAKSETPKENIHFADNEAAANRVMTVGKLKALLQYYEDNSVVFISDDTDTTKAITGFFSASDSERDKFYLVLTTRKDAPSETYQGPGKECKVNA